jgi:hypothetical protein
LQPKSEKCIFVGYSEDVKGYRLLQPHCNEIIIGRDVKFDENILAYEPNLAFVPSLACKPISAIVPSLAYDPSSEFVPSFIPIRVSSSDDDSEDENPPPPAHPPPDDSFEPEPAPVPSLPRWVHSTQLVVLSMILQINVEHVHSSSEPLLFGLNFLRLMIQRHFYKLQVIHIGIQQ